MEEMIRTENLAVGYNGKILIDNITLSVEQGTITVLIGPNGSGKSTILKTITKNLKEISGVSYIGNKAIKEWNHQEFAKKVSVVWTDKIKPELMTCNDVVAAGRYPYTGRLGILSEMDREEVRSAMELIGISHLAECDFNALSDGQKQRVMIARAVCQRTPVLILDEPTSYLDIRYKAELFYLLKKLAKERGTTIILSVHEMELAKKIADYVICVKGEKIFMQGKPQDIFHEKIIRQLYDLNEEQYNFLFDRELH